MNKLGYFIVIIVSFNNSIRASDLREYFRLIKNLEFQKAIEVAEGLEDIELSISTGKLAEILLQKRSTDSSKKLNFSTKEQEFVNTLLSGYQELYSVNSSSINAYKKFTRAIHLGEELNHDYLVRAALQGMLELLSKEIFIGSKQYAPYLDYLNEIRVDTTDDIVITFYEIIFYSKANENLDVSKFYDSALIKLDSIFKILPESHNFYPYYFHEKGIQKKINEEYQDSYFFFKKAEKLSVNNVLYQELYGRTIWQLADLMQLSGKLKEAKTYLRKSQNFSKSLRDEFYNDRLLSLVLRKQDLNDSAYNYLLKSVNLEYRLGYKNNSLESSILAVQNETDKLKLDKLRLDNRRKTNQNYLVISLAVLVLGTLTAVFLQKNTTKKRLLAEKETLLKQERVDNLLKQQELVSIDAMIAGQEKERQRVANELHDDLGSLMATIKLHFDNSKVSKKDPSLKNAQKLLEEAYQKVRGMAHAKNSGVMSDQGLLPAIKKMAQVITETNAMEVLVEAFGMGDRLENSLELNLFRMVQELVANTIKHAQASKVTIQLTQHEDNLNIIIEDNGKGFDRSKVATNANGMGLTSIEKRIEHLEGSFTIDSILGKGTSILIDIPV